MSNTKKQAELLAPAGSIEGLKAAIHAGADAVYIGGPRFGARAYAESVKNSENIDILKGMDYAHIHGRKLYLTVNTLLKQREIEELTSYIRPYYENGLDAAIVQDMGVFKLLREEFPDLPIHASTQMTITGVQGAMALKKQGAKRVVLARELSLDEISAIHQAADVEIEAFVHGALCVCYSGQCLFSSILGGRSGNRGRCAQPCRLPYQVYDEKTNRRINGKDSQYPLSPKDIGAIDILPEILESGVYSLKIEGRMKRAEYAAGVVHIYRKYLDQYLSSDKAFKVSREDRETLLDLYSRGGVYTGYYKQHNGKNMMSMDSPAYRTGPEELFHKFHQLYIDRELKHMLDGTLVVKEGQPVTCQVTDGIHRVEVSGEMVQPAVKQPASKESLEKQMRKTGNTPFSFENLEIQIEGNVFVPVKALNELRREALDQMTADICNAYHRKTQTADIHVAKSRPERPDKVMLCASVENREQLDVVLKEKMLDEILLESSSLPVSFEEHKRILCNAVADCHKAGKKCFLVLPVIMRKTTLEAYQKFYADFSAWGFDGVYCRNLEELNWLCQIQYTGDRRLDYNLYTMNLPCKNYWLEQNVDGYTLPVELNAKELLDLGGIGSELLVYGYLTLMTTAQCVHKNFTLCDKKKNTVYLEDRYRKHFRVRNRCTYCYNTVENSLPLSLFTNKKEVAAIAPERLRLQFTCEKTKEIEKITDAFCKQFGQKAGSADDPVREFTRGHFKRGIE